MCVLRVCAVCLSLCMTVSVCVCVVCVCFCVCVCCVICGGCPCVSVYKGPKPICTSTLQGTGDQRYVALVSSPGD